MRLKLGLAYLQLSFSQQHFFSKLNAIEANATADQTATEIATLYEGIAGVNRFTNTLLSKLNDIEDDATADLTATEISALYEGISGVNRFTDALLTKLNAIEAGATADQNAAEIRTLLGNATRQQTGLIELASNPETVAGTDDTRAVTPLRLANRLTSFTRNASSTARGFIELATQAEVTTGTDTERAVTPATLEAKLDALFAPGAPTSLFTSNASGSSIDASWTAPTSGANVSSYRVEWRTGSAAYTTASRLRARLIRSQGWMRIRRITLECGLTGAISSSGMLRRRPRRLM